MYRGLEGLLEEKATVDEKKKRKKIGMELKALIHCC